MIKRLRYLICALLYVPSLVAVVPPLLVGTLGHVVVGNYGEAKRLLSDIADVPDAIVDVFVDVWYGGVR